MNNIRVLTHSSIRVAGNKVVYVDPFKVNEEFKDADYIFVTHSHFDHYSPEDIEKVSKGNTLIIVPASMKGEVQYSNVKYVDPDETFELEELSVQVIRSYNVGKPFHTKDKNWVGYVITMNNESIYIAGDTDLNEDVTQVKCDVALVPIGGKYTMTALEAAKLVNTIKPKLAIPTHYGNVAGSKEDELKFIEAVDTDIKVEIRMENYEC